jgi:hypothetical protein
LPYYSIVQFVLEITFIVSLVEPSESRSTLEGYILSVPSGVSKIGEWWKVRRYTSSHGLKLRAIHRHFFDELQSV